MFGVGFGIVFRMRIITGIAMAISTAMNIKPGNSGITFGSMRIVLAVGVVPPL